MEQENDDDNKEPNPEPEPEDIDAEIASLLDEVGRLTAENSALTARVGECESAIATLREHKHEREPEPAPEPPELPEPEPAETHLWFRRVGGKR